jgi:4-diphosphocytidyl-2-C-methyl-D-erythritol kinase
LSLRVLGKRADGYHKIRTVLQTITLRDTLIFEVRDETAHLEIFCDDSAIPTDECNLIHKAATLLCHRYGVKKGARIDLEKRIPSGGGLGGGSSNAAIALLALSRLWEIPATFTELSALAAKLGADVPFFLTGGTALGTGIGATITPLEDGESLHLIVVTPRIEISTAQAYAALNASQGDFLTNNPSVSILSGSHTTANIDLSDNDAWRNDFESVVYQTYPQTEAARARLLQCGARRAMLSGSGASVFGIFDKADQATACSELRRTTDWRVFSCETLAGQAYQAALHELFAVRSES